MHRALIAAVGVASLLTAVGGAAQASERTPSERVSIANVDFRDPAAVKALYERLRSAARDVCRSPVTISATMIGLDRACVDRTVAAAVHDVDRPMLTALANQNEAVRTASGY